MRTPTKRTSARAANTCGGSRPTSCRRWRPPTRRRAAKRRRGARAGRGGRPGGAAAGAAGSRSRRPARAAGRPSDVAAGPRPQHHARPRDDPAAWRGPAGAGPAGAPPPGAAALSLRLPGDDGADGGQVSVSVQPGARVTILGLIRNQSDVVDNFDLSVRGLPDDWWTIAPATAYLVPYGSGGTYEQEVAGPPAPAAHAAGPGARRGRSRWWRSRERTAARWPPRRRASPSPPTPSWAPSCAPSGRRAG